MQNPSSEYGQNFNAFIQSSLCKEITKMLIHSSNVKCVEGEKPYKRGYYTGAFDMFHYGHLLGIQNALNYCDQLIVAVSTDEVIRDYKHREPIIPFEQRLAIVSAIKGVTLAIPQYDLYNKMDPAQYLDCDVIFSSEEYLRSSYEGRQMTPKQQAGVERWEIFEQQAREGGIDVMYLPRTNGISSSDIKSKIVENYLIKKDLSEETTNAQDETEATCLDETQVEETSEQNISLQNEDLPQEAPKENTLSEKAEILTGLTQKFMQGSSQTGLMSENSSLLQDNGQGK